MKLFKLTVLFALMQKVAKKNKKKRNYLPALHSLHSLAFFSCPTIYLDDFGFIPPYADLR